MSADDGTTFGAVGGEKLTVAMPTLAFVHPADRRQRWVGTQHRGLYCSSGDYLP